MEPASLLMESALLEETFSADGAAVSCHLRRPVLPGQHRHVGRINRFYGHAADDLMRYAKKVILPAAEAAGAGSGFEVHADFTVTWNDGQHLSLYRDIRQKTYNSVPDVLRISETWDIQRGTLCSLEQFIGKYHTRDLLSEILLPAAQELHNSFSTRLFQDYPQLLKRYFNRENFYLTPDGPCLFYQPGRLAPVYEGVVVLPAVPPQAHGV